MVRVSPRTTLSAAVAMIAVGVVACGGGRNYDNPPEIPIGTGSTTIATVPTTRPSTTAFVPSTAPTTLPPSTVRQTAPPTNPPPPPPPTEPVATTGDRYTVRQGDTLFGISQVLGVPLPDLLAANGLDSNSLITPGTQLAVPQGGTVPEPEPATTSPPTTPAPTNPPTTPAPTIPPTTRPPATQPPVATSGDRYTVVAGDTLSGIARRFGVSVGALRAANDIQGSHIEPGQVLVIPAGGSAPAPTTATTQPPAPPTTRPPAPPPAGQVVPRETSAGCQAPDSEEADRTPIVFAPGNVLDGNPATAWRCETGADLTMTFRFDGPTHLASVGLIGGYVKVDSLTEVDRFPQNHRVRQVRWTFSDGTNTTTVTQDLSDSRNMQTMPVDVTTTTVTLEIVSTYPPPPGTEDAKDMVAVAEVQFTSG